MSGKGNIVLTLLTLLGVALVAVGIGMIYEFKKLVYDKISKEIPLKNGSDAFNTWTDPPVPVYMQFYVFDLQNAEEVVKSGEKPAVVEKGPYTYREIRTKEGVLFEDQGAEILYRESKAFVFVPEMSVGLENDTFTTVNLPMLKVASTFQYYSSAIQGLISWALSLFGEHLFMNLEVGAFLWGYEIKTVEELNKYLPVKIKEGRWGLFYGPTANGSNDGDYLISSGTDNLNDLNVIKEWKGNNTVPYWNTEYCRQINGTDGTMWHPYVKKSERLYIFSSDICRSIYITYQYDHVVKGIHLYHFSPPRDVFGNHTENPDNEGYCTPDCLGSGVLNVSVCKDAPIIISQPHFYLGAEEYIDAIVGMKPTPFHQTYVEVEPYTGVAMNASKKLQINAHIKALDTFSDTAKFNSTIYPILWLDENAVIDESSAHKFLSEVKNPITVLTGIQYGLIGLGALLLLACSIILVHIATRNKHYKQSPLLIVGEDDEVA